MVLLRKNPNAEFETMHDYMDRIWRTFGNPRATVNFMEDWSIPLDVVEEGDDIVVHASLPGIDPENIKVTVEHDVLTIKAQTATEQEQRAGKYLMAERRTGSFHRALRLPDTVDAERVETKYHNGVLSVTFPKQETKKARQIPVKYTS